MNGTMLPESCSENTGLNKFIIHALHEEEKHNFGLKKKKYIVSVLPLICCKQLFFLPAFS